MKKHISILLVVAAVVVVGVVALVLKPWASPCPSVAESSAANEWTYQNEATGFLVPVPAFLCKEVVTATRDGKGMKAEGAKVTLEAWAASAESADGTPTPESARKEWVGKGGTVTYESDWNGGAFSMSGLVGDTIYYDRYWVKGSEYRVLRWMYPTSMKEEMDVPVTNSVVGFNEGKW